jgi:hypothetical protein
MRKLIILGAAALLAGVIGAGAQATPLAVAGAAANSSIEHALPDQGATQVKGWNRGHHYGWYRGHHYGWRHHSWHRHAYWHR